MKPPSLVVVGGSWGAIDPLCALLRRLGPSWPTPIVVTLHRSARAAEGQLEDVLAHRTGLSVGAAADKAKLTRGYVHVAPADYHLLVEDDGLALSVEAPEHFSRPSINVLFESAARARGAGLVAVLLSGANDDGAHGCEAVRRQGGAVLVQSPATAVRREMPTAALGSATLVGSIDQLADFLLASVTPNHRPVEG